MRWRRKSSFVLLSMSLVVLASCGHSEDEWQAKVNEGQALQDQLNAEKAAHQKTDADLSAASRQVEELKNHLKKAGVDLTSVNATLTEQATALDKLRKDKEQLEQIRKRFELLKQKLQVLTKFGLSVTIRDNRMAIELPGDVLFDSGRTDLKKDGKDILLQVAEVIRNEKDLNVRSFQVAGHTDSKPLGGGRYKDNWGLSVMRAREVLTLLIAPVDQKGAGGGLSADRWSAAGYGETDPVAANDSPENMRKNRRVELVVLPNIEEMLDLRSLIK
jgi:chemotaxis protein MotB